MSRGGGRVVRAAQGRHATAVLIVGLMLVAFNLRFALTSVGPVIGDIRADAGLSGTAIGLLTTAPLLALGLFSPIAPRLAERFGAERVLFGCMVALTGGVALRGTAPVVALFLGTVVAGCAIAVGNVLLPGVVKARFAERASLMTGVYSVALSAGAALAAGLTVPIEELLGGSWRLALAVWAVPAVVAAVAWLPQLAVARDRRAARAAGGAAPTAPGPDGAAAAAGAAVAAASAGAGGGDSAGGRPVRLLRDRRAWAVTFFMGIQSTLFYTLAAWLPAIVRDSGTGETAAGVVLSIATVIGLPFGLGAAALAGRVRDQRPIALVAALLPPVGWLGLLLFPGTPVPSALLVGIGTGIGFPLALTLFVLRARDARQTAALSGMAQAVGYTLAAVGPLGVGALHDLTGGWALSLVVLSALAVPQLIAGLIAAEPGYVGDPAPAVAVAARGGRRAGRAAA